MNEPARSTVRPEGWVGDPAQLERARRYRAFIKRSTIPLFSLVALACVLMLLRSSLQWLLFLVAIAWAVVLLVLEKRIGRIIGRKWSPRLEDREGQQQ